MCIRPCCGGWLSTFIIVGIALATAGDPERRASNDHAAKPELSPEDKTRVEKLQQNIEKLRTQGGYADAIPLAEEIVQIRGRVQGDTWFETQDAKRLVNTLKRIAELPEDAQKEAMEADRMIPTVMKAQAEGQHDECLRLAQQQLAVRRKWLGDEDPEAAMWMFNVASVLESAGRFDEAESLCRDALNIQRKLLGGEHPQTATALNELAVLRYRKDDYAGAEAYYREALAICRRVWGEEHPEVAVVENNLAALLDAAGDYAAAEALYRQSLATKRKHHPDDEHLSVANGINNLAGTLESMDDYASAEEMYLRSLALYRKLLVWCP